jgi:hypothetical protein
MSLTRRYYEITVITRDGKKKASLIMGLDDALCCSVWVCYLSLRGWAILYIAHELRITRDDQRLVLSSLNSK